MRKYLLLPLCLFWFLASIVTCVSALEPRVVVSEVMWAGSNISTADEWIEFVAVGGSVDISGWQLRVSDVQFIFPDGSIAQEGVPLVLSNYSEEDSRLSMQPDFVDTSLSLPNSKLFVELLNADGDVMDSVDDGSGSPYAGSSSPKASMERIDLLASGTNASNWRTATETSGFDAGEEIFGTPGFVKINKTSSESSVSSESSQSSTSSQSSQASTSSLSSQSSSSSSIFIPPKVIISEILANPDGNDDREWIEIQNRDNHNVTLAGWILSREGSSTEYVFPSDEPPLKPNEFRVYEKTRSKVSLPNDGGTVSLNYQSVLIDTLSYPKAREDESYGSIDGSDQRMAFCIPTKNYSNDPSPIDLRIDIQSGEPVGEEQVTLNLQAESTRSLSGQECSWNFGDGFYTDVCNPPSHTFDFPGKYEVVLTLHPTCSAQVQKSLKVHVFPSTAPTTSSSSASSTQALSEGQAELVEVLTQEEEGESEPVCTGTASGILLSEIYPSPSKNEEEWIELYNELPTEAHLCGWTIDDVADGGSSEKILDDIVVPAHSYSLLQKSMTSLALNNGGDDVRLVSPSGHIQSVTYPSIKTGKSYAYDRYLHEWCLTDVPTEKSQNICAGASASSSSKKSSTAKAKSPITVKYTNVVASSASSSSAPANLSVLRSQMLGSLISGNNTTKQKENSSTQWLPMLLGVNAGVFLSLGVGGVGFLLAGRFRGLSKN